MTTWALDSSTSPTSFVQLSVQLSVLHCAQRTNDMFGATLYIFQSKMDGRCVKGVKCAL